MRISNIIAKKIVSQQDEFDVVKYLKEKGKGLTQQYGPQFGKHLDKALQNAKPIGNKFLNKPTNQLEDYVGQAPQQDPTETYNSIVKEVNKYHKELIPKTQKLLKVLYDNHTELAKEIRRIDTMAGELRPHATGKKIHINEDSADLMNKMEESRMRIRELISGIVDGIESINDDISNISIEGRNYEYKSLK